MSRVVRYTLPKDLASKGLSGIPLPGTLLHSGLHSGQSEIDKSPWPLGTMGSCLSIEAS